MVGTVCNGDIFRYQNGKDYIVREITVDGTHCHLIVKDTGEDISSYRLSRLVPPSWAFRAHGEKQKPTKKYVTAYCSDGCGAVKIFTPGEIVSRFRCETCSALPVARRQR